MGKSTLFNRLVGRRSAIVHDRPGVTRDRKEGVGTLAGLSFRVFDTAGLETAAEDTLEGRMRRLTLKAVADADVALLLIDAKAGIVPLDEHFADLLRQQKTPVILVANKCESKESRAGLYEAFRLGLGEAIDISAEHGQGLEGLYRGIAGYAPPEAFDPDADEPEEVDTGFTISEGVPLRLSLRKPKNPFVDEESGRPTRHSERTTSARAQPSRGQSERKGGVVNQASKKPKKMKNAHKGPKPRSLKGRATKANGGKKVRIPRRRRY